MNLDTLKDLYVEQLKDLYSAEKQLTETLPKLARAASRPELRQAFESHLSQTNEHMTSVQMLLRELDANPGNKKCVAMEGLVEEATEMAKKDGDPDARDAGLILAAQKAEHYEIASYGGARTFAETLGYDRAAKTLQHILDQEYEADQTLDNLAMGLHGKVSVNRKAMA